MKRRPSWILWLWCLAPLALLACHNDVRDWAKCDHQLTACRAGFACDTTTWRCVSVVDAGVDDGHDGSAPEVGTPETHFACNQSPDCHDLSKPACDLAQHVCVGCVTADDCTGDKKVCDTSSQTCVGCLGSGDCTGDKRACDVASQTCVGCLGSSDCTGDKKACDLVSRTCVGCLGNGDCAAPKAVCDTSKRTCVGCQAKSDCAGTTPACDVASQTCVGCLSDSECSGTAPLCAKTTKTCVACTGDDACVGKNAATPVCATSGACVACKDLSDSKAHCTTGAAPICDAGSNSCRACKTDAECATAYGANPGLCVSGQCLTDAQVIYLRSGSSCGTGDGSFAAPYCDLEKASQSLSATRSVMLVRGPGVGSGTLSFTGAPVTIAGQNGPVLVGGSATTAIVAVKSGDVTLRDLTISGATAGTGVSATGGTLRMTRCQVLNNDSGIKVAGAGFDITNTIVAGTLTSNGVSLGTAPVAGPMNFAFNTVANNATTGVFCSAGTNYQLNNDIVSGNAGTQVVGCSFTDACATTCSPTPSLDAKFHLTATSTACIDRAAGTAPADDIDGDLRPQGSAADCGADEKK